MVEPRIGAQGAVQRKLRRLRARAEVQLADDVLRRQRVPGGVDDRLGQVQVPHVDLGQELAEIPLLLKGDVLLARGEFPLQGARHVGVVGGDDVRVADLRVPAAEEFLRGAVQG